MSASLSTRRRKYRSILTKSCLLSAEKGKKVRTKINKQNLVEKKETKMNRSPTIRQPRRTLEKEAWGGGGKVLFRALFGGKTTVRGWQRSREAEQGGRIRKSPKGKTSISQIREMTSSTSWQGNI